MGFSVFEKNQFRSTLRDASKIEILRENSFPEDVLTFLNSEGLRTRVRDYAIMSKIKKTGRPENITITYMLDADTNIHDILLNWQEFLSPPVSSDLRKFSLVKI